MFNPTCSYVHVPPKIPYVIAFWCVINTCYGNCRDNYGNYMVTIAIIGKNIFEDIKI